MFRRDRSCIVPRLAVPLVLVTSIAFGQADSRFKNDEAVDPIPTWAQPLKGGPIRTAAVFPIDAEADFAALERQIEMRLDRYAFGRPAEFSDAFAAALKKKPGAVIVAGGSLANLSAENQAALKGHVERGGGLLCVWFAQDAMAEPVDVFAPLGFSAADPAPDFAARAGGQALTGLQPGYDVFSAYTNDAARAVELRFWSVRPQGHALIPLAAQDSLRSPETMDNYLALVCHALRWTAGLEPEAIIRGVHEVTPQGPNATETPPQLPERFVQRMQQAAIPGALRQFSVSLDRPAPRTYDLRMQIRYPGRGVSNSFGLVNEISKGAEQVLISVPAGSGDTFVDVWLLDGMNVVDWFTQPLHLYATPELTELSISASAVDANDSLHISANVEGHILAGQPQLGAAQLPIRLFMRVTDNLGREVARRDLSLPPTGGMLKTELPLIDLLTPYARADIFAAFATEPLLDWWTRARADHRVFDLLVHQPLQAEFTLITDDPGEGSFAGSARRHTLAQNGVQFVAPGTMPTLGNIAADGMRLIADLGNLSQFPGDDFGLRTEANIAIRQAAAPFAAMQPGLYTVTVDPGNESLELEPRRAAMETALRVIDPRATLALLRDGFSAPDSGGFRVVPADPVLLHSIETHPAAYIAVRSGLPTGGRVLEQSRWLPWLTALSGSDALWITESDGSPEALETLMAEARRIREGFDLLFRTGKPEAISGDGTLEIASEFSGLVKQFSFGKAKVYAFLADPNRDGKSVAKLKAKDDSRIHELTASTGVPQSSKSLSIKLRAGETAVAAILPYEVSRIVLRAPEVVPAGRRLTVHASVKTRDALPGDHILRVTLTSPGFQILDHYSRTVVAPEGEGFTWIPLAFNDVPGKYRVTVRDLLTQTEATADISVVTPLEGGRVGSL